MIYQLPSFAARYCIFECFLFSQFSRFCFPFVQLINSPVSKRFKVLSINNYINIIYNSQNLYSKAYSLDAREFYRIYVLHSIGFIRVIVERMIDLLPIIKRLLYSIRRFQCLSLVKILSIYRATRRSTICTLPSNLQKVHRCNLFRSYLALLLSLY